MATFTRFEEMEVWQTARRLTKLIYTASAAGAFARDFGLRDQMRRAAVSVMSNIAEGCDSRTEAQFNEYLGRARASCGELRCQLYIARDLDYISSEDFRELFDIADKCSRQISRLMHHLEMKASTRVRDGEGPVYWVDGGNTTHDCTSHDCTSHE